MIRWRCEQELCRNWTGQGCICEVMGVDPDVVVEVKSAVYEAENDRVALTIGPVERTSQGGEA